MSYKLQFYETSSGRAPALEFLRGLSKPARAEAGWLLERLERYGHGLERPVSAYLRDGIHELRWQSARNEYRLLFFFSDRWIIVVTHGFPKKTQRVPAVEIELAMKLREEWLSRCGGEYL